MEILRIPKLEVPMKKRSEYYPPKQKMDVHGQPGRSPPT